jgi:hypothetical protein
VPVGQQGKLIESMSMSAREQFRVRLRERAAEVATLKRLAQDAYELDAFKPNLTSIEAAKRMLWTRHRSCLNEAR